MLRRILLCVTIIFSIFFVSACGNNGVENEFSQGDYEEYPYGHYEDDEMIGTVANVNQSEHSIVVDISEWEKRDRKGPGMNDDGFSYTAKLTDQTVIKDENDKDVLIDDIKKGQKVLVNPPREDNFNGQPDEIILLEMSYDEKFSRLLSQRDDMHLVIMYKESELLPVDMEETLYENVMNILQGTEHSPSASWVPYEENYVVDYKKELDIEQFPAMLVFDSNELLFKSYHVDEFYEYFRNLVD